MPTSSRLKDFVAHHASDPDAAMAALRRDLTAARGPLVEPLEPPEHGRVLVTFVYITDAGEVQLSCQLQPTTPPATSVPMQRLDGTDVWYASVPAAANVATTYQFQLDPPSLGESLEDMLALMGDEQRLAAFLAASTEAGRSDPFNPELMVPLAGALGGAGLDVADEQQQSVLSLPAAAYATLAPTALKGGLQHEVLDGRDVTVYLPPEHDPESPLPLIVLLDGELCLKIGRLEHVLDAAMASGDLPRAIVVFWHNLSVASRMIEMACNPALPAALAEVLLPWLTERYAVSSDPRDRVIAGFSYGGLAAAHTALARPEVFGSALPMSASFWFTPDPAAEPGQWLTRQYAEQPVPSLSLFVAVGTLEDLPINLPGAEGLTMVSTARAFRDTLLANSYRLVGYREVPGGHDMVNVRQVVVPGLQALLART
ncbi:MAG: alpha/beta hydrolase [Mycobacteriales bacterium]